MGEENTTSIYLRVVQQIAELAGHTDLLTEEPYTQLIQRLNTLTVRIAEFTRFGLIAPFPGERFMEVFNYASDEAKRPIATVLEPYVDGIEARLTALEELKEIVTTYVEITKSFLSKKEIAFTLREGVMIRGVGKATLDPNWLSSGEKQLVLLLSNTILARDSAGIFLIDEPELSLNIKWQRRLVEALLRSAHGANIQYVLASHSLELITQHRGNAVRLLSESDEPGASDA